MKGKKGGNFFDKKEIRNKEQENMKIFLIIIYNK
jgi:hypothetical protein